MKDEYDFSKSERGKFYRTGLELVPPHPARGGSESLVERACRHATEEELALTKAQ